jgi:hypothetical protein
VKIESWIPYVLCGMILLLALTVVNRARHALQELVASGSTP